MNFCVAQIPLCADKMPLRALMQTDNSKITKNEWMIVVVPMNRLPTNNSNCLHCFYFYQLEVSPGSVSCRRVSSRFISSCLIYVRDCSSVVVWRHFATLFCHKKRKKKKKTKPFWIDFEPFKLQSPFAIRQFFFATKYSSAAKSFR